MADVFGAGDDFEAKAAAWIAREAANPTSQLGVIEAAELARLRARVAQLEGALRLYADDVECDLCERTVSHGDAARQALGGSDGRS